MAYRSVYCYAWDLAELGVPAVASQLRARQINTITLACAYHAGKFIRPKGQSGKVFFPEDGTVYFHPSPALYGEIKPVPNSLLQQRDVLRELGETSDLAADAWLVLLHNTRLGQAYPQATVVNACGDRYIYNLCPSAPAVREYAVALCTDLTQAYPVGGISLETPGFLPYRHGYHHEFALIRQNPWIDNLLGLCFCQHCVSGAQAAGVDAGQLQLRVRAAIEDYLASELDFPDDMAAAFWFSDTILDADFSSYLRWRCRVVTSLVQDIRQAVRADATVAVIPSVARPSCGAWYEGSDLRALMEATGVLDVCFYESGVARIRSDVWDVKRRVDGAGRLRGLLRPSYPDLGSRQEVIDAVAALNDAGIEDVAFYAYGHLRTASLDWMGAALAALER